MEILSYARGKYDTSINLGFRNVLFIRKNPYIICYGTLENFFRIIKTGKVIF